MFKAIGFNSLPALAKYVADNSIAQGSIVQIYFANGGHVLCYYA